MKEYIINFCWKQKVTNHNKHCEAMSPVFI
jgi:hypothetical protein